jgi:HAD superfamily hydrolase (TIGR01490 family)
MKKQIAIFDFDGTITLKDSFIEFLNFVFGRFATFRGLFALSPILVLYKIKLVSNETAKKRLFSYFFKGMKEGDFSKFCQDFSIEIDKYVNPVALQKLKWHQEQGHQLVIITASVENWIIPWAEKNNINTVIGTRIEIINRLLSGDFASKNCYGPEKVRRFLIEFPDREGYNLYIYGDSRGDRDLLAMADHKFLREF